MVDSNIRPLSGPQGIRQRTVKIRNADIFYQAVLVAASWGLLPVYLLVDVSRLGRGAIFCVMFDRSVLRDCP